MHDHSQSASTIPAAPVSRVAVARQPADLVYQAGTLAAILLVLASIWVL